MRLMPALVAYAAGAQSHCGVRCQQHAEENNSKIFERVYRRRVWGGDGKTSSLSGKGSSLKASQRLCALLGNVTAAAAVENLAAGHSRVSFLDAPMGDLFWMSRCLPRIVKRLPASVRLDFYGVDVAATAVNLANQRRAQLAAKIGDGADISAFELVDLAAADDKFVRRHSTDGFDVVMCNDAPTLGLEPRTSSLVWLAAGSRAGLLLACF